MPSIDLGRELAFLNGARLDDRDFAHLARFGDTDWLVNDSSLQDYGRGVHFPAIPLALETIVKNEIGVDKGNVGLDLAAGSNGLALQDLLRSGVLNRAIMTNYEDRRIPATHKITGLDHVEGDLMDPGVWQQIITLQEQHAPEGLALVMHRPSSALQNLSPAIYRGASHLLLNIMRSGGFSSRRFPTRLLTKWGIIGVH